MQPDNSIVGPWEMNFCEDTPSMLIGRSQNILDLGSRLQRVEVSRFH